MSLSWDEKATELIQRFVDEQITLTIAKQGEEFVVTGAKANGQETRNAQSDDLVVALMLLAGMEPSSSDRQDYDPGQD
ncbi:MAG TPA: hypothetical protein V6D33_11945 [Cyanophyceae cyanobacterium]